MNLYPVIYKMFDNVTPIDRADCGQLCGGACCKGDDMGMYLFPGEERLFEGKPGFRVEESDFVYGNEKCKILFCSGSCNRRERPLACRIFPLVPMVHNGEAEVCIDPRGRGLCPLAYAAKEDLNPNFVKNVRRAALLMMRCQKGREYLEALTGIIELYNKL